MPVFSKVQLIVKDKVSFDQWGTFVTTPFISNDVAQVNIKSDIAGEDVRLVTKIKDAEGVIVAKSESNQLYGEKLG